METGNGKVASKTKVRKNYMKTTRILSCILALAMVLSMFPSGIFAVDNVETAEQTGVSDGTITGWHAYVGSPTITHTRKAMQVTSSTFPGVIVFTDRGLKNYVLETELSFSGGTSAAYAGVMVRSGDGYNVFHNLSSGSNALVNHQVSGNKWPNTVSSTSTVTCLPFSAAQASAATIGECPLTR